MTEGVARSIGIDLGTTNSLVASHCDGRVEVLCGAEGERLVPSVVYYAPDGRVLVGARARAQLPSAPERVFASIKRLMGRMATDPEVRRHTGHHLVVPSNEVEARQVRFDVDGRTVTPIEVSSEILRELSRTASATWGAIGKTVVTVPAYFDDAQRQATRDAAKLAGLTVSRLLNEPTAALLAYGLESKKNGLFAVYDLGGGTFDVTILRLEDGIFQVKSVGGDTALGGDDFDALIAERMASELGDRAALLSGRERLVMREGARTLKHRLTDAVSADVEVSLDCGRIQFALDRATLREISAPLLERTGRTVRRALRDAAVDSAQLDGLVLVGGMTRMVAVRDYVTKLFGQSPVEGIDPDEIVACGAALRADFLSREDAPLLLDALPLSLGIETFGGAVEKLLPRNSNVPAAAKTLFTTHQDAQTGFVLNVVQGERPLAKECRSLGTFTLRGIPPMSAGQARLEVTMQVDESGLLTVSARELTSGTVQVIEVAPASGLTTAEIDAMLFDALKQRKQDNEAARLIELRVHGESVLRATAVALAKDGDLVTPEERVSIDEAVERLRQGLVTSERSLLLELLVEELHVLTREFSERRMNRAVVEAVTNLELR